MINVGNAVLVVVTLELKQKNREAQDELIPHPPLKNTISEPDPPLAIRRYNWSPKGFANQTGLNRPVFLPLKSVICHYKPNPQKSGKT